MYLNIIRAQKKKKMSAYNTYHYYKDKFLLSLLVGHGVLTNKSTLQGSIVGRDIHSQLSSKNEAYIVGDYIYILHIYSREREVL